MRDLKFGAFLAPITYWRASDAAIFAAISISLSSSMRSATDEFWCGEHHSSGWETIASPEMFLAGPGERTKRIKARYRRDFAALSSSFNVAQRMVQLDHMTGGRAIFGSGPGALASDDSHARHRSMTQRDRQDEAMRSFAGCSR